MGDDWKHLKLRDLCDSIDYGLTASASDEPVGPHFLRITDIVRGGISWSTVPYVAASNGHVEKYRLRAGDIVIARTGATTGYSACVLDPPDAIFASYLVRFTISPDHDARFVSYKLKSPQWWDYIHGVLGDKSAQPNASASTLADAWLDIPPLPEQRAIAEVLGALDDKIEANERLRQLTEELLSTLFQRIAASSLANVADDEPLPTGWRRDRLESVLDVVETGSRPKGGVSSYSEGVPSLGAESVLGLARFDFSKTKFVPIDYFTSMKRGIVHDQDVLLYKDGGRPGEFEPHVSLLGCGFPFTQFCINEHVYRLRAAKPLTQEFLYYWLSSEPVLEEMRRRGTGVAIPGLNSTAVKELPIAVPPVEVIERFSEIAAPLVSAVLVASGESRSLAQLRDALLPKLMSGELRVTNDVEDLAPANI